MISLHLLRIYRTCDKVIIRNVRSRRLEPGPSRRANPGMDNRIAAFKKDGLQITHDDAEELIENSESDFYQVHEQYNEHMNETLIGKYELRHQIVKEKYFKENTPNLITWSEKEQIRHLALEHPEEWTPEKIAESFPITVPVVKKLLKYPWKPATVQRIARHDASVMRNWRELKEGTFEIPEKIRQHFLKFSERSIPPLDKKSIKIDVTPEDKNIGEFERIVQRCAAKESKKNSDTSNTNSESRSNNEEPIKKKVQKDPHLITLNELTAKIKGRIEKGNNVAITDQLLIDTVNKSPQESTVSYSNEIQLDDSVKENQVQEYTKQDNKDVDIMNYPERIRIPKKAYKKDATYKVNDCYYDHDGKFLYRVLGMTG